MRRQQCRGVRAIASAALLSGIGAAVGLTTVAATAERRLEIASDRPGERPAHHLRLAIAAGDLEIYRAVLTYPNGFVFNGFNVLGPVNTQVGAYAVDVSRDGIPEVTIPLRSLDAYRAYLDVIQDDVFTPDFEPVVLSVRSNVFIVRAPYGGDADAKTTAASVAASLTLTLFQGLITNPAQEGQYVVRAELTSVDPDTDGPDDGVGASPSTFTFEEDVTIVSEPTQVEFDRLLVTRALVQLRGDETDRFVVEGRYVLGADSDGIDLRTEDITVRCGGFTESIPGGLLAQTGRGFRYLAEGGGIRQLTLDPDGRFRVDVRGPGQPAVQLPGELAFELRIGSDHGRTSIPFDRHGHYSRHHTVALFLDAR